MIRSQLAHISIYFNISWCEVTGAPLAWLCIHNDPTYNQLQEKKHVHNADEGLKGL